MTTGVARRAVADLQVKAAGVDDGVGEGVFVGYASVFGNVDSYGDIVDPGAFTRTIGEWKAKGATIPVLWGHDMYDAFACIGGVTEIEQDEIGLKVTCELDLDNPTGAQVFRLLKGRRVKTMSFAFSIRSAVDAEDGYHLQDLDLHEVSVVHVPANPEAEVLAVKESAQRIDAATLTEDARAGLKAARDHIDSVLAQGEPVASDDADDQEKASEPPEVKTDASDEGQSVKSSVSAEEPKRVPSADNFLATISIRERTK